MTDQACPFCGSKTKYIDTPFIDRWTGEAKKRPCCLAQKKNVEYLSKRRGSTEDELPEDITLL